MIEGYVRWAVGLALGGDGDDIEARRHLGRVDPLLRRRAKRALQNQVEAIFEEDPNAEMGRPMLEAVARRMKVEPRTGPKRAPMWWATLALVALFGAGGGAWIYRTVTAPPPFDPTEMEVLAESAKAYEEGGRPLSLGEGGEELFGSAIGKFVIALDRRARTQDTETEQKLAAAEARVLDPNNRALIGEAPFTALENLVDACHATLIDGESVQGDVDELNAALAGAGLAYYIDSDLWGDAPMLYAHLVERVRIYDVPGGAIERVLWLRRLDKVNVESSFVGSTHEGSGAAVIRRNLVDSEVLERLLPALAPEAPYALWPLRASEKAPEIRETLERVSGEKIREDMKFAGLDLERGAELAALLLKRAGLFDRFEQHARSEGYRIARPTGYRFKTTGYERLDDTLSRKLLRKLDDVDEALGTADMGAVYSFVRENYVAAVELHEVRHRLDYGREPTIPAAIQPYVGVQPEGAELSRFARRLITEYSAFLAEMAGSTLPCTTLVRLSRNAFNKRNWDTTYAETAVAVIDSLASAAGISHSAFVTNRAVAREELARVYLELLAKPCSELNGLARTAWQQTFDAELATPVLRPLEKAERRAD